MKQKLITICARANSKRLKGKNLKLFDGRPLIAWTIEQAIKHGHAKICVSTDSQTIIEYVRDTWRDEITTIERPPDLCRDDTPKIEAIRHAHHYMESMYKAEYDPIIDLDCTNPLRKVSDIRKALELYCSIDDGSGADTLFSVVRARRNPYWNQVEVRGGLARLSKPFNVCGIYCGQDAPVIYDMNCCIYIYRRKWLIHKKNKHPVSDNSIVYEMPEYTFVDTDTLFDFEMAEWIWGKYGYGNQ